jgi:hypothetical protein
MRRYVALWAVTLRAASGPVKRSNVDLKMTELPQDFADLLIEFVDAGAEFLLVGGWAVDFLRLLGIECLTLGRPRSFRIKRLRDASRIWRMSKSLSVFDDLTPKLLPRGGPREVFRMKR